MQREIFCVVADSRQRLLCPCGNQSLSLVLVCFRLHLQTMGTTVDMAFWPPGSIRVEADGAYWANVTGSFVRRVWSRYVAA